MCSLFHWCLFLFHSRVLWAGTTRLSSPSMGPRLMLLKALEGSMAFKNEQIRYSVHVHVHVYVHLYISITYSIYMYMYITKLELACSSAPHCTSIKGQNTIIRYTSVHQAGCTLYMLALPYLAYITVDLNLADWAASVAQLAEHWTSNPVVTGSNPVRGSSVFMFFSLSAFGLCLM